ncbi:MAG: energy-coupling factor transporter transmembrane component T [Candidatus Cryosericum sp.]|nr:energy-coupling factor transporter transmembrane protein EcfT [bacterium]
MHRSGALVKLISTIVLMIGIFVATRTIEYIPIAVLLAIGIITSRIPLGFFVRGLRPILLLIVLTVAVQLFFTPGRVVWQLWFIHVTREGLGLAGFIMCRLVLLTLVSVLLTASTSPIELTDAVSDLLKPLSHIGVPSAEIALVMSIAMRFVPTILEETERIIRAQVSRGARIGEGSIVARMKSFIPILIPLFVSSFRRADDLAVAMEARGFRVGSPRTRYHERHFRSSDVLILGGTALAISGVIVWRLFL